MGDGETIIDAVKGMRKDVEDTGLDEIVHQFVNVLADLLDVPVLGFVDIQRQDVNLAAVLGEIGRDFFADESVRQMGDFQRAFDAVVVRDGDKRHAPCFSDLINLVRFGETFGATQFLKNPLGRAGGEFRMDV